MFAFLAIAAFPPNWASTQFQSIGGFFSIKSGSTQTNGFFFGNPSIVLSNTAPSIKFYETDSAANEKSINVDFTSGTMTWSLVSDDGGTVNLFQRLTRSGATPVLYEIVAQSVSFNGGLTISAANEVLGVDLLSAVTVNASSDVNTSGLSATGASVLNTLRVTNNANFQTNTFMERATVTNVLSVGSYSYTISTNLTTADATPTIIASFPVPVDAAITINAIVTASQTSSANGATYHVEAAGSNNGGTTAIISTQTIVSEKESITSTAGVAITFDNTTDTGRVTVTGVAATGIKWGGRFEVIVSE